jgi:hypothetical protein
LACASQWHLEAAIRRFYLRFYGATLNIPLSTRFTWGSTSHTKRQRNTVYHTKKTYRSCYDKPGE